jgi:hypothetical protein
MTEEQEWCLACGAAVGTRVVAAPGWRAPLIIVGVIATIAAIAVAVAIVQLADDTGEVAQEPPATAEVTPTAPPASTPVPTATPDPSLTEPTATPEPTNTPEPTTTPEATNTPDASSSSGTAEWPSGKSGWTVVLASTTSQSSAEDKAEAFAADGISGVGVLDSDDFGSLKPGFWVVFAGEHDTQEQARDALDGIDASDAYVRRIEPN